MNSKSIALNILQANNEQKISHLCKSEFNKRQKKAILLRITDNEKQHYLDVKRFNSLLKRLNIVEIIA